MLQLDGGPGTPAGAVDFLGRTLAKWDHVILPFAFDAGLGLKRGIVGAIPEEGVVTVMLINEGKIDMPGTSVLRFEVDTATK